MQHHGTANGCMPRGERNGGTLAAPGAHAAARERHLGDVPRPAGADDVQEGEAVSGGRANRACQDAVGGFKNAS